MRRSSPLWLRVDGAPLEGYVSYGGVKLTSVYGPDGGGFHNVEWQAETSSHTRYPVFRGGALVEVCDAASLIGTATMREPDVATGQFSAEGIYRQAERFAALNSIGEASARVDIAIDWAEIRGSNLNRGGVSISSTAITPTETGLNTVASLLASYVEEISDTQTYRWVTSPAGVVSVVADPTTPSLHLAPGLVDLGTTQTGYASTVVGRFNLGSGFVTRTLTNAIAAEQFGPSEVTEDFTVLGSMSSTKADKILAAYLREHSRPAFTSAIEVTADQLTTEGGAPVDFAQLVADVPAGVMVRAQGYYDDVAVLNGQTHLDFIIGEANYTDGAETITLAPLGLEPASFVQLLAAVSSKRKRFAA